MFFAVTSLCICFLMISEHLWRELSARQLFSSRNQSSDAKLWTRTSRFQSVARSIIHRSMVFLTRYCSRFVKNMYVK
ncbi:hypothetical protein DVU_2031 [Nitratidesulfovibrio vulgaris str. Hildenborough]|uniref:Uncharacterized protein n=1 Tax=Nitratidesulfovibrio vulgaris (strain ATCC 29579 / DSM 644 / CCUG 34227 / NCIMB 8303 / VKM B-1760 / Hildenborough) TaxID=882 RepID=Q72AG4_NITV2|nr:hypothetical protein DVU_2031 [Nitratidesulfovibrio vulgaris str. Hildenborough]